ncbi:hypothetical protein ABZ924_17910 [Streptomyces sp. NPDC046876]|uniref:hypothetical protein n=1 Tax=Streptomyces sp. NPDC046876 TaxID=3155616 RepID=UPI0033F6FEFE
MARTVPLADAHGRPAFAGVGTVTVTAAGRAEAAFDVGAAFLVSPYPAPEVREVAARRGAVFAEGGFCLGEIAAAVGQAGAARQNLPLPHRGPARGGAHPDRRHPARGGR